LSPDFYRGRSVLVTGGTGFIGSNLVGELLVRGAEVAVLARSPLPTSAEQALLFGRVRHFRGDVRDPLVVREAVAGRQVIFNLAGHSGSISSNDEPFDDLEINLRGQLELLEASRRLEEPPMLIFASSRLVYRPTDQLPVPETAPTGPLSLYGVHKLAGENYHLFYRHRYGLGAAVLRITNPYGHFQREGQNRYGIINWFIHLALSGNDLPVYGDGDQVRDYVHIDDVVRAFLAAGSDLRADGQVLNIGGGAGVAFVEMAEMAVRTAGSGRVIHRPWPEEAARVETGGFVADVSRAADVLGWRPEIPLAEGLRRVVAEYREPG